MHYSFMADEPTLKQRLPYPFNQDLSQVLRHLDRRTQLGRESLANDPVTAAYLAAAMRLVTRHVGPVAKPENIERSDEEGIDRSIFGFLTQRTVAAEMANNPEPFPRGGNVSTMRSTWKTQSGFIADVLNFALSPGYYPENYQQTRAQGAERLIESVDPAGAIEDLAYRISQEIDEMVSFRLELIAVASAERSEVVRQALAGNYQRAHALWKQVYAEFLEVRRLRLRDGMTLDQLACILTSVVEGATLRSISDPDVETIDHIDHRSLLGTAALALLNGCLEPVEEPDGRSVREALQAIVTRG
jgi:hypothetical protein